MDSCWSVPRADWRRVRVGWAAAALATGMAASAGAQPVVGGASGTVAHDQTITISGSSFGSKGAAAPHVWENFNDGSASALNAHGVTRMNNADNLRHANSVFNARVDFKASAPNGDHGYYSYEGQTASRWFVQYWVKLAPNWQWGTTSYGGGNDGMANVKFFRMFPTGSRNYTNAGYSYHGFGDSILRFSENAGDNYISRSLKTLLPVNQWHSIQVEFGENSGAGAANGRLRLWIDGQLVDSTDSFVTNAASDGAAINKRPYIIGFFDSWPSSDAAVSNMYASCADIYVDSTFSRVEIGNAASYGACTRREIQIPTSWSNGSITARVNQGGFTGGQQAYVYVVDANGQVNASGFPVTIGGQTAPPQPLAAPVNVRIVTP